MSRVRAYSIVVGLGLSGAMVNCGGDDSPLFAPTAGSGGDIGSSGGARASGGAGAHPSSGGSAGSGSDLGGGAGHAQGGSASGGHSVGGGNSGGAGGVAGTSGHGGSSGGINQGGVSGSGGHGGASGSGGHGGVSGSGGHGGVSGSAGSSGSAGLGGSGGVGGNAGDNGAAGAGGPDSCQDNADCAASEYCAKVACASLFGHCAARPLECSAEAANAVCGCDGVTYHDACLLQKSGQNKGFSNQAGACEKGALGTLNCTEAAAPACASKGGVCGFKVGSAACSAATTPAEGVCWVLPAVCPAADPQAAALCGADAGAACVSECAAIQQGQPYTLADTCGAS